MDLPVCVFFHSARLSIFLYVFLFWNTQTKTRRSLKVTLIPVLYFLSFINNILSEVHLFVISYITILTAAFYFNPALSLFLTLLFSLSPLFNKSHAHLSLLLLTRNGWSSLKSSLVFSNCLESSNINHNKVFFFLFFHWIVT